MTLTSYDLCGPNPNPMTREEVDALKDLVRLLPPDPVIVNIGAERGTSTLAMLEARPDAVIFSIDIGECAKEFENLALADIKNPPVIRLLGRSQVIGRLFPYFVDMVFVDGDHSYSGVCGDIDAWKDKVTKIMVFHDYIPNPPPEIKGRAAEAIDEKMDKGTMIRWTDRLIAFKIS